MYPPKLLYNHIQILTNSKHTFQRAADFSDSAHFLFLTKQAKASTSFLVCIVKYAECSVKGEDHCKYFNEFSNDALIS